MLRRVVAVFALACATPAVAADLPPREPPPAAAPVIMTPAFTWTGFYIGGHFGGAFGDNSSSAAIGNTLLATGNELEVNSTGFLGGGHVGFNYQFGSWVVGLEGEGSWTDLSIGRISSSLVSGTSVGFSADSNWLAMATARVGYTAYQFLFYLKGGVAWMDADYTASALTGGVVTNSVTVNDTRVGWVVGGGAQLALSNNWSIRAEYNYIDFGTEQFLFPLAAGTTTIDVYSQIHAFKVGASYLFN